MPEHETRYLKRRPLPQLKQENKFIHDLNFLCHNGLELYNKCIFYL